MLAGCPSKFWRRESGNEAVEISRKGWFYLHHINPRGGIFSSLGGFVHMYYTNLKNATKRILPQLITRLDQTTSSVRSHCNGGNKLSSYANGRHGDDRGDDGDGGGGTLVA